MKYFLIILAALLLLLSCDSSTSPEKNSISGLVTLENSDDYSGVTVRLYKIDDYPDINLFDHRFNDYVYEVTTDSNGEYEIFYNGNINNYVIVFEKEGYGYKYLNEYNVTYNIDLYQEVTVPEIITGEYVFESGRHYIFKQNTIFLENSSITLNQGTFLRIAENKRIDIYGSIREIYKGTILVTKITSLYAGEADGLYFSNTESVNLTNVVSSNLRYGINFEYCNNISINFTKMFNNTSKGLLFSHCSNVEISNYYSQNINNTPPNGNFYSSEGAIQVINSANITISNLEINQCQVGIKINNSQLGVLSNLNIHGCYYGLELYESEIDVTESFFYNNNRMDMRICGEGTPKITYNIFNSDFGLKIGLDTNYDYINSSPIINNNDFYCQNIALKQYGFNRYDIDAIHNYFNTTSISEINDKIVDGSDLVESDTFFAITGEFIIEPFETVPNSIFPSNNKKKGIRR